ncbi:hypothetical protein [Hymenobacter terricola]|uniref:hypothetical protein n=1 Tax=Hymenobacter terricola TaxID=2819236 RepID=UPI001B315E77|nr:hypothetical protein [Hymenobacter terricola]
MLRHPGVTTAISSPHIERFAIENLEAAAEPPLSEAAFYELRTLHRWVRNFYTKKCRQGNDLDAAHAVEAALHGQS